MLQPVSSPRQVRPHPRLCAPTSRWRRGSRDGGAAGRRPANLTEKEFNESSTGPGRRQALVHDAPGGELVTATRRRFAGGEWHFLAAVFCCKQGVGGRCKWRAARGRESEHGRGGQQFGVRRHSAVRCNGGSRYPRHYRRLSRSAPLDQSASPDPRRLPAEAGPTTVATTTAVHRAGHVGVLATSRSLQTRHPRGERPAPTGTVSSSIQRTDQPRQQVPSAVAAPSVYTLAAGRRQRTRHRHYSGDANFGTSAGTTRGDRDKVPSAPAEIRWRSCRTRGGSPG